MRTFQFDCSDVFCSVVVHVNEESGVAATSDSDLHATRRFCTFLSCYANCAASLRGISLFIAGLVGPLLSFETESAIEDLRVEGTPFSLSLVMAPGML